MNQDTILNNVLTIATMGLSADEALNKIIAYIGAALHADRCYIYERFADIFSNTFEWTAKGIEPQIMNRQDRAAAEFDALYRHDRHWEKTVIPDIEAIKVAKPQVYDALKAQNVRSLATMPLLDNNEIIGFYGVDNPPAEALEQSYEVLKALSYFIVSELRHKMLDAHDNNNLLDAMHTTGVFVITEKEHKILYYNYRMKLLAPGIRVGDICYDVCKGPCTSCPLLFIREKRSHTCANCDTPFGVSADITATKFLWKNSIPAYIMLLTPHANSLDEHEVIIRGMYIDVMNDMFFKSVLVDLDTGNYESFYVASHSSSFAACGVYDNLVNDQAAIIDESYRDIILENCSFQALKRYFEKGNRKYECVYRTNRKDGFTWLRCIASICPDTYQGKKYMIVMVENVTEAKEKEMKAERDLQTALNQAKAASIAKTTFLSSMSHDIRTPMNAILGYASIAASNINDTERVEDSIQKIMISGKHLQGIINGVLDMSRIESGKVTVNLNKTSISKLIKDSLYMIQTQAQKKQQTLYVDAIDIKNEILWTDATKMQQVLVNVLGNAVKFTGVGGTISLTVIQREGQKKDHAKYIFKIKDNGIGMSRDFIDKIFDAFEQEDDSSSGSAVGTGLGMAISKNFVEMMGGTICVESEEGKGSEFVISLEFKVEEHIEIYDRLKALKDCKVLVVDDDFQSYTKIAHMFGEIGIHTDWTEAAERALFYSRLANDVDEGYAAYIIDWTVPDMNGLEVTREIRKFARNEAPIVILTEHGLGDMERAARKAGATSFCTKPLFVSDLAEILLHNAKEKVTENITFDGENILLVEDNAFNTEISVFMLKKMGFHVQTAENGEQALDIISSCEEYKFQYILMDLQMPGINGFETAKKIRELDRKDTKKVPIIAVTANAFKEDEDACYKAGMNGHIAKPFKKDDLINILAKVKR